MSRPPSFAGLRSPLVCGALGRHDRGRVLRMAAALGAEQVRLVHEDSSSALALDREPLRWAAGRTRGLGWIEGLPWEGAPVDWQSASLAGGCGLVLDGRRRRVHSSVSGIGAVYWLQEGDAVYFASRLDPLVQTSPRLLTLDWDAWSSIVAMRFPGADRTPFAEIRRLGPHASLSLRRGRVEVEAPTWPWLETEEHLEHAEAGERLAHSLRATAAAVDRPVLVPLSGGRDSRLLACTFGQAGLATGVVSVSDDEGDTFEEDLAAPVASALGLEQVRLRADPADYPRNWQARARLVEHQFVDHAWLVPLSRYAAQQHQPISDGFALDVWLASGTRFFVPETLKAGEPRRASLALFDSMRRFGHAEGALAEPLRAPVLARARDLFLQVAAGIEGHHNQTALTFYRSRSVRGIACYPTGLLGQRASVVMPATSHEFVTTALSATAAARQDDGLYRATFEALAPGIGRLPSTSNTPRREPHLPRAWRSDPSVEAHRRRLRRGPLARLLAPELRAWLTSSSPRAELDPGLRLGLEGISLLHSWWWRYRDQLHEVDVSDLTS